MSRHCGRHRWQCGTSLLRHRSSSSSICTRKNASCRYAMPHMSCMDAHAHLQARVRTHTNTLADGAHTREGGLGAARSDGTHARMHACTHTHTHAHAHTCVCVQVASSEGQINALSSQLEAAQRKISELHGATQQSKTDADAALLRVRTYEAEIIERERQLDEAYTCVRMHARAQTHARMHARTHAYTHIGCGTREGAGCSTRSNEGGNAQAGAGGVGRGLHCRPRQASCRGCP